MTVRIKKQLGSPAVQDLIERARKRARELPIDTLLDPWPDSRRTLGAPPARFLTRDLPMRSQDPTPTPREDPRDGRLPGIRSVHTLERRGRPS